MFALPVRPVARLRRRLVALVSVGATVGALGVPLSAGPAAAAAVETISADSLRTPSVNGIVYSVAIVGNVAYAAGDFTSARPPGALPGVGEVPRNNLLSFNLTTGALLPWAPVVTGTPFSSSTPNVGGGFCDNLRSNQWVCDSVLRIKPSPDGSRLYIGGDFSSVDGQPRYRLAAFDTATGALVSTFRPAASSRVRALAVTGSTVYAGGGFTSVNGTALQRLAAFSPTNGALQTGWAAGADAEVWAMAPSSDQSLIVVGGGFASLGGASRAGVGTVSATTGAAGPWSFRPIVKPGYERTTDIAVDGSTAYMTGSSFGGNGGNDRWEGRAAADVSTGKLIWYDRCLGDSQGVAVSGGVVYSVSHSHDCSAMRSGALALKPGSLYQRIIAESTGATGTNGFGEPRPDLLPVFPNTDAGPAGNYFRNGPWAIATNGTYVVIGGEFTTVNGIRSQGLGRFVLRHLSPRKVAPQAFPSAPRGSTSFRGGIDLSWPSTWDRDDYTLTYNVYRDGDSSPVYTTQQSSYWWNLPSMGWNDGSVHRSSHTYVVTATDSDGNVVASASTSSIWAN